MKPNPSAKTSTPLRISLLLTSDITSRKDDINDKLEVDRSCRFRGVPTNLPYLVADRSAQSPKSTDLAANGLQVQDQSKPAQPPQDQPKPEPPNPINPSRISPKVGRFSNLPPNQKSSLPKKRKNFSAPSTKSSTSPAKTLVCPSIVTSSANWPTAKKSSPI